MGSVGVNSRTSYQIAMMESSIPKRQKAIRKLMNKTSVGGFLQLNSTYKLKKFRDDLWQLYKNDQQISFSFGDEWLKELTATKTRDRYM